VLMTCRLKDERQEKSKKMKDDTFQTLMSVGGVLGQPLQLGDYSKVKNKWFGEPAYVVGGGPTLATFVEKFGWDYFRGKHTIGINHIIEDFDGFEWFFFLDKRFLEKTTYDMSKYKGLIIAQHTTGLTPNEKTVVYRCRTDYPADRIEDGLYSSNLSGLAALNLAIIAGANPIYMVGHGMGESSPDAYHHKPGYTGEVKNYEKFKKFQRVGIYFNNFSEWKHKIFSISNFDEYPTIKNIPVDEFKEQVSIKVEPRLPRILHLSFCGDLARHAETTIQQVSCGHGIHKIMPFGRESEWDADAYVLNHFLSTDRLVNNFAQKNKAAAIVHTRNCTPVGDFKKVVAMSDVYAKILEENGCLSEKIVTIPSCISPEKYLIDPDYDKKVFGRITRWSTGKIPDWWNDTVKEILNAVPQSSCLMYVQKVGSGRDLLSDPRMVYDETVYIFENKNLYLSRMSVYCHANGFFKEISPHAILEAMASGLPVIYLHEDSIAEMVGDAGIDCLDKDSLQKAVIEMLCDKEKRVEYGRKSRERVKLYSKKIMLEKYDRLIKELTE